MHATWFGQGAFLLRAGGVAVAIDPFGEISRPGWDFHYPPVEGLEADLLLVTHEHLDHNYVDGVVGDPAVIRSTAGTFDSPVGEVVAVASEHDQAAGTERGPNTIFSFVFDGVRVAHFGDFGQQELRPEQKDAVGDVDVLFLPAGDGPTVGGERAAAVVRALSPSVVVPMHYRTPLIGFLDPPDALLEALAWPVEQLESNDGELVPGAEPRVVLFQPPAAR